MKKKKIRWDWTNFWGILFSAIVIGFVLALIGIEIYTMIRYGGKPASEIPGWVWWFWFRGGSK